MAYQQKLTNRPFAVIELFAKRTTMEHIGPLLSDLRTCIDGATPGVYYTVGDNPEREDAVMRRQGQQLPDEPPG